MVSIIIVSYAVKEELFSCISSIYSSNTRSSFEIILIDNDDIKTIYSDLHNKFPYIKYIPNNNKGYGQAVNVGVKQARGEYVFILNPDTEILKDCIDLLLSYLYKNRDVGIIAPLLYHKNKKPFLLQGLGELTPFMAIFVLSFINKIFPRNPISRKYWNLDWTKESVKEVFSVPGTAFMIQRKLFEKIGGFDENFFLYFEEIDFCKRISNLGWKIIMHPKAKVYHYWGSSTKKSKMNIKKIFAESRFYYLRKHFGIFQAFIAEGFLRTNRYILMLFFVILLGLFLSVYNIANSMTFIGDQSWFYLSAREMIITGHIPLVGIESSRPWLHQGAFWTYLLAGILWLFNYNPVGGAYLSIIIGIMTIVVVYIVGSELFSRRIGIFSALLYSTSPLIVINNRTPYHTSPIPLLTVILIFCIYKWLRAKVIYFPLILSLLAILYNFEIATVVLFLPIFLILGYGLLNRKKWVVSLMTWKLLFLSVIGFFVPLIPMILYDISHNFSQTLKFLIWIPYRLLTLLYFLTEQDISIKKFFEMIYFLFNKYNNLIFINSSSFSFIIMLISLISFILTLFKQGKKLSTGNLLIVLYLFIPLIEIVLNRTPSEAYLPLLFPIIILFTALFLDGIFLRKIHFIYYLFIVFIVISNIHNLIKSEFLNGFGLKKRIEISKEIVRLAEGKSYNLKGEGPGSEFKSFTMNYEYLTWWLGHGPSKKEEKLYFLIEENNEGIKLKKVDN